MDTVKDKFVNVIDESKTADSLYDKNIVCPVCSKQIFIKSVKSSTVRVVSQDSDFMTVYMEPNPILYGAWSCNHCGYTALSNRFENITQKQADLIRKNITERWKPENELPQIYDINIAIKLHQLALLNTIVKLGTESEKASVCLRIGWLYRLKQDTANENRFLSQALQCFQNAYDKEKPPYAGLNEDDIVYLIGELFRRQGDNANAIIWFGRVLASRTAKASLKDMARSQKDIIRSNHP